MTHRELRLTQAQLRMKLRELEVEIQRLRHEQRFYRRMGFERDLQDMQMVELLQQKRECEEQLRHAQEGASRRGGSARAGLLSWLMLPPLLVLMGLQSLFTRRVRTAS